MATSRRRRGPLLPAALAPAGGQPALRLRTAVVAAVTASGVTLTVSGGEVTGVARLASYPAPAAGDNVQLLTTDDGRYLILGPTI